MGHLIDFCRVNKRKPIKTKLMKKLMLTGMAVACLSVMASAQSVEETGGTTPKKVVSSEKVEVKKSTESMQVKSVKVAKLSPVVKREEPAILENKTKKND